LAALAETSISEGKVDRTVSIEARSEGVRRKISRRHSVARALNIDNEMRRELKTNVDPSMYQLKCDDSRPRTKVV
jgi:hypothetical protein